MGSAWRVQIAVDSLGLVERLRMNYSFCAKVDQKKYRNGQTILSQFFPYFRHLITFKSHGLSAYGSTTNTHWTPPKQSDFHVLRAYADTRQ